MLIILFLYFNLQSSVCTLLDTPSPKARGSSMSIPPAMPTLSSSVLQPALVGDQLVLVCDTERIPNPSLLSLQSRCWAHPGLFPVMLLCPSCLLEQYSYECSLTVSASAGIPSPAPVHWHTLQTLPLLRVWVHMATPVSSSHESGCSQGHPHQRPSSPVG